MRGLHTKLPSWDEHVEWTTKKGLNACLKGIPKAAPSEREREANHVPKANIQFGWNTSTKEYMQFYKCYPMMPI
jgi:hypothetical protein